MMRISIIGPGRVGGALALSLPSEKYSVENLIFRSDADRSMDLDRKGSLGANIASLESMAAIASDIIFITTPDPEIAAVAEQLADKVVDHPIVYHTSGALSSSILGPLTSIGCLTGSIHPLVSISMSEFGPARFQGAFFCIEGHSDAVGTGYQLVEDLGGRPFSLDTKFKTLYHAAAVTACGHLVALFDAAVEIMTKCGLSPEESKNVLLPLVTSTVQNLAEQSTTSALTGTFARADIETFTRHLTALNENVSDELLEIYLLLGERSLELAAKQGVSPARIETLRTRVSVAKSKLKW